MLSWNKVQMQYRKFCKSNKVNKQWTYAIITLVNRYRFFIQWAEYYISKKSFNKNYLYKSVNQLYLNKLDNA